MGRLLCNAWVAAILIIVVLQVGRTAAQNSGTRNLVPRGAAGYQRYRRRHISGPPCINGISSDNDNFSDLEAKVRESEYVFTGKVTAEVPSVENRDPLKKSKGELCTK
jgi:hypothetical protein